MNAVQTEMHKLARVQATPEAIATYFFDTFGVVAAQHLDGKLWLFDYDQLAAHKHRMTQVVRESRGLVLDAATLKVVRQPFARFFNIGEVPAYEEDIDFTRLVALEKADGSLITIYYNTVTAHWQIGTRGTPFADSHHRLGGKFYDRVTRSAGIASKPGTEEFDEEVGSILAKETTYLFEFIGPDNPHITPHETSELVLLGARQHDGVEFTPSKLASLFEVLTANGWNVRNPASYEIGTKLVGLTRSSQVEAIKNWVALEPLFKNRHEGVVCFDIVSGKRLKVKTPLYCAAHLQGKGDGLNITLSRIIELVVTGDAAEFCLYVPHLAPMVETAIKQVEDFLASLKPIWEAVKDIADQKEFALAVHTRCPSAASGLFFQSRKSGITPQQVWLSLALDRKTALAERVVKI
jgi:hypothetical protein